MFENTPRSKEFLAIYLSSASREICSIQPVRSFVSSLARAPLSFRRFATSVPLGEPQRAVAAQHKNHHKPDNTLPEYMHFSTCSQSDATDLINYYSFSLVNHFAKIHLSPSPPAKIHSVIKHNYMKFFA